MAFNAKDGKPFGNRQQMKAYDERAPKKETKAMPEQSEPDGDEGESSDMPIHEMVAQHGPAEKVEISHSEGKHTKVSHHGGKKHMSEHASAEEAHHHGMMAAGVEPGQEEAQPAMAGGGGMQEGGIPGM
jgi:hypothetical protein